MNTRGSHVLLAGMLLLGIVSAPRAATVDVSFVAQNFIGSVYGATAPQDPVTGSFSIQHDSAADFTGAAVNPVLVSISLIIDGYTYNLANTELNPYVTLNNGLVDFVQLGGALGGFPSLTAGTDDFNLILAAGTYGAPSRMRYTTTGTTDIFLATNTAGVPPDVTFTSSVAAVPVPAAGLLMLSGVVFMGRLARRRV